MRSSCSMRMPEDYSDMSNNEKELSGGIDGMDLTAGGVLGLGPGIGLLMWGIPTWALNVQDKRLASTPYNKLSAKDRRLRYAANIKSDSTPQQANEEYNPAINAGIAMTVVGTLLITASAASIIVGAYMDD